MDKTNAVFMVEMRVRIHICLISMGRPSCVPDSDIVIVKISPVYRHSLDAVATKSVRACKFGCYEHRFVSFGVVGDRYNTTAVIAARFKNLQALDAHSPSLGLGSKVPHNATTLVPCGSLVEVLVSEGS
jgi:hypothetical protein